MCGMLIFHPTDVVDLRLMFYDYGQMLEAFGIPMLWQWVGLGCRATNRQCSRTVMQMDLFDTTDVSRTCGLLFTPHICLFSSEAQFYFYHV